MNPVTLIYTNYRDETSERTITPQRVWYGSTEWHPEPQWLITAFDHKKHASRDFTLKDFGNPAPSLQVLYGPFAHLNGYRNLDEATWFAFDEPAENNAECFSLPLYALKNPFAEIGRDTEAKADIPPTERETALAAIATRLIKWDTDCPVNTHNGYAGLKELDRIIADAKTALGDTQDPDREEL